MSMWTLLFALLTAIAVWFLLVRKLTARPWVAVGNVGYTRDIEAINSPAKKVGLYFLLGAITSLFALFMTAYFMRMDPHHGGDWYSIDKPGILWVNTFILVAASITMQWAKSAVVQKSAKGAIPIVVVSGLFTLAFLCGQFLAWRQLYLSDYFHLSNPALGFFYLLTGVHGIHLLGGLYVWARTITKYLRKQKLPSLALSIELCALYWHYLLLVWLVLFALLLST